MRRALICGVVLAGGVLACAAATPTRAGPDAREITLTSVGGWRVGIDPSTTYAQALRRFGPLRPPSIYGVFEHASCLLVSRPLGLRLDFGNFLPGARAVPQECTQFFGAYVWGSGWHTANGLSIGASLRSLRASYPKGRKMFQGKFVRQSRIAGVSTQGSEWWLTPMVGQGAQPILIARIKRQRVVALGIEIVGH